MPDPFHPWNIWVIFLQFSSSPHPVQVSFVPRTLCSSSHLNSLKLLHQPGNWHCDWKEGISATKMASKCYDFVPHFQSAWTSENDWRGQKSIGRELYCQTEAFQLVAFIRVKWCWSFYLVCHSSLSILSFDPSPLSPTSLAWHLERGHFTSYSSSWLYWT